MENISQKIDCSIVVSVYNEEECVRMFYHSLSETLSLLQISYEIIFVNDGSTDNSLSILKDIATTVHTVKVVSFSRNFGHEAAMIAGIDHACGEAVICMDSDLQHPPAMIPEMLKKWQEGNDIVLMVRNDRKDGGFFRNITSKMFYSITNKLLNAKLEPNASDFFMISQRIIHLLKSDYRERTRFMRGYIQIIGFNKTTIKYVAPSRVAGESKYSFFRLLTLSFSAISTLSKVPLKLGLWCGLLSGLFSIVVAIYSLIMWIIEKPIPGYTTLIIFLSLMFCINFIVIGIIGEYIGHLFDEVKERPIYVVESIFEIDDNNN